MSADLATVAPRPPSTRSRVGNGNRPFASADGRSVGARLLRDREHGFAEPLGGLAALSPIERAHVESAAVLSVRLEQVRSGLARGDAGLSDEDMIRLARALASAVGVLDRLAAAKRKASQPAGPHALKAYLAAKAEAAA
jgi:hypothetical protein